jgi:hypothetical protein
MWRALVLAAALAAVAAAPAAADRGRSGKIVYLSAKRVTIHGPHSATCRIGTSSVRLTIGFFVGNRVVLTCRHGLLTGIRHLGAGAAGATTTTSSSAVATATSSVAGGNNTAVAASGSGVPILAISPTSITIRASGLTLTCAVGHGSPDLAGFEAGDRLSRFECRSGVLTGIARAP